MGNRWALIEAVHVVPEEWFAFHVFQRECQNIVVKMLHRRSSQTLALCTGKLKHHVSANIIDIIIIFLCNMATRIIAPRIIPDASNVFLWSVNNVVIVRVINAVPVNVPCILNIACPLKKNLYLPGSQKRRLRWLLSSAKTSILAAEFSEGKASYFETGRRWSILISEKKIYFCGIGLTFICEFFWEILWINCFNFIPMELKVNNLFSFLYLILTLFNR